MEGEKASLEASPNGLRGSPPPGTKNNEMSNQEDNTMRWPEEGGPPGADPGMVTYVRNHNAIGQQPRGETRRRNRAQAESNSPRPSTSGQRDNRDNQQLNVPPAESVSQSPQPETTRAGLPRRRIQWSLEMNEFTIRTYFRITRCDTNATGWRQELHQSFVRQYPSLTVTEQNLADRRSAIIRRNLIPITDIERIKAEVQQELAISGGSVTNNEWYNKFLPVKCQQQEPRM